MGHEIVRKWEQFISLRKTATLTVRVNRPLLKSCACSCRDLKTPHGDNLFMSCVSELVLETREFEMLLGQINLDGSRKVGSHIIFGDILANEPFSEHPLPTLEST